MIKNIIFDMGGVLIDYNPEKTLYSLFSKEQADILLTHIFRNKRWADKDRGTLEAEDFWEEVKENIPLEIRIKAKEMLLNFYPYMPPFEEMYTLIKQLREKGFGIYLLSNASKDFYERKSGIPALSLFDGYLISADHKLLKPEKEIYLELFKKFSLSPAQCIFIDDMQVNVDGAIAAGMQGYCHTPGDTEALKNALRKAGVDI